MEGGSNGRPDAVSNKVVDDIVVRTGGPIGGTLSGKRVAGLSVISTGRDGPAAVIGVATGPDVGPLEAAMLREKAKLREWDNKKKQWEQRLAIMVQRLF